MGGGGVARAAGGDEGREGRTRCEVGARSLAAGRGGAAGGAAAQELRVEGRAAAGARAPSAGRGRGRAGRWSARRGRQARLPKAQITAGRPTSQTAALASGRCQLDARERLSSSNSQARGAHTPRAAGRRRPLLLEHAAPPPTTRSRTVAEREVKRGCVAKRLWLHTQGTKERGRHGTQKKRETASGPPLSSSSLLPPYDTEPQPCAANVSSSAGTCQPCVWAARRKPAIASSICARWTSRGRVSRTFGNVLLLQREDCVETHRVGLVPLLALVEARRLGLEVGPAGEREALTASQLPHPRSLRKNEWRRRTWPCGSGGGSPRACRPSSSRRS